jgi:type 1 fimbriae regulatory protein FimB/type 1 fimbriae regulatory protein FimE
MKAAGNNRHGHRDATMILMGFRHGLRASELCSLRWDQVDLVHGRLHVHRLKNGIPSVHPLTGSELRALRRLHCDAALRDFNLADASEGFIRTGGPPAGKKIF